MSLVIKEYVGDGNITKEEVTPKKKKNPMSVSTGMKVTQMACKGKKGKKGKGK